MKILLCKPYWPYPYGRGEHTYNRIWPPLCLANYAAILEKENHDVKILDAHALRIKPRKIKAYVQGFDKIFITSSSLDRWQCPNIDISSFLETVRCIREMTDEIYIMGYHGTVDPAGLLSRTRAKAVIRGEAENAIAEICEGRDLKEIRGITHDDNGTMVSTQDRDTIDLKTLPVPAFHLLDAGKYSYEILGGNFALFEIGRGCKWRCKFCNQLMYQPGVRAKSATQVVEEVQVAVEGHGVRTGYFMDLEFLANKGVAAEVCDVLAARRYDFRWCCQTRADSLDPEIARKMKKAGCELIHMGVESGIQKFLDLSGKHTTKDKLHRGVQLCEEAGIKTLAFFMFGLQGETAADREETSRFARELNTDFVSFHKVYPYQKSDIYLSDLQSHKEIDAHIFQSYLKYYLRFAHLKRCDLATLIRSFRLFWGRLITLT